MCGNAQACATKKRSLKLKMAKPRGTKLSYLLYAVASAAFILYFSLELNASVMLLPFERIALIAAGCAGVYFGSMLRCGSVGRAAAARIMRRSFAAFFALYILLTLTFTLFDDAFGRNYNSSLIFFAEPFWESVKASVNLVPFRTIMLYIRGLARGAVTLSEFCVNLLGNLLAFMPMAFFLPLLFNSQRKWWRTALTTALCVCSVELMQLIFQKGSCDIDDLLLNVAGAVLAYFILWPKRGAERIDKLTYGARFAEKAKPPKQ